MKFAAADIGKLKASMTTGNISQLLMRLVMKAEFIERRSMQCFAHRHDFERIFNEDFLEIDWMDKQCAEENMLGQIKKFFARKLAAGMHSIHPEDIKEFHDKTKEQLEVKAQEWAAVADQEAADHGWSRKGEKAHANAEFFTEMADSLHEKITNMNIGDINRFIWQV